MTLKQRIEKLNREINNGTYHKTSDVKIPKTRTNKASWRRMFNAGFRVIARKTGFPEQQWYLASEITFIINSEREFKLADKDWEEGTSF